MADSGLSFLAAGAGDSRNRPVLMRQTLLRMRDADIRAAMPAMSRINPEMFELAKQELIDRPRREQQAEGSMLPPPEPAAVPAGDSLRSSIGQEDLARGDEPPSALGAIHQFNKPAGPSVPSEISPFVLKPNDRPTAEDADFGMSRLPEEVNPPTLIKPEGRGPEPVMPKATGLPPKLQAMIDSLMDSGNVSEEDKGLALARAGFAIMGGTSPHAGVNIGQGALQGLTGYETSKREAMKNRALGGSMALEASKLTEDQRKNLATDTREGQRIGLEGKRVDIAEQGLGLEKYGLDIKKFDSEVGRYSAQTQRNAQIATAEYQRNSTQLGAEGANVARQEAARRQSEFDQKKREYDEGKTDASDLSKSRAALYRAEATKAGLDANRSGAIEKFVEWGVDKGVFKDDPTGRMHGVNVYTRSLLKQQNAQEAVLDIFKAIKSNSMNANLSNKEAMADAEAAYFQLLNTIGAGGQPPAAAPGPTPPAAKPGSAPPPPAGFK